MDNWKSLADCDSNTLRSLGITNTIMTRFNDTITTVNGSKLVLAAENLYHDDQPLSWSHPLVYFDGHTHFEFRFTPFQGDWSDDSQFERFFTSYRQHLEQFMGQECVAALS